MHRFVQELYNKRQKSEESLRADFAKVLTLSAELNDWFDFYTAVQSVREKSTALKGNLFEGEALAALLNGLKYFAGHRGDHTGVLSQYLTEFLSHVSLPSEVQTDALNVLLSNKKYIDPFIAQWIIKKLAKLKLTPGTKNTLQELGNESEIDPYLRMWLQKKKLISKTVEYNLPQIPDLYRLKNNPIGAHKFRTNTGVVNSHATDFSNPAAKTQLNEQEIKRLSNYVRQDVFETYSRSYEIYIGSLKRMGFNPNDYKGKVVLDLGTGLSEFVDYLAELYSIEAYGLDLVFLPQLGIKKLAKTWLSYHDIINWSQQWGLQLDRRIGASITYIPLKDASVDAVVEYTALKYLSEQELKVALEETLRVLKVDGTAYISGSQNEKNIKNFEKLGNSIQQNRK